MMIPKKTEMMGIGCSSFYDNSLWQPKFCLIRLFWLLQKYFCNPSFRNRRYSPQKQRAPLDGQPTERDGSCGSKKNIAGVPAVTTEATQLEQLGANIRLVMAIQLEQEDLNPWDTWHYGEPRR
jgi:hypothetical protein